MSVFHIECHSSGFSYFAIHGPTIRHVLNRVSLDGCWHFFRPSSCCSCWRCLVAIPSKTKFGQAPVHCGNGRQLRYANRGWYYYLLNAQWSSNVWGGNNGIAGYCIETCGLSTLGMRDFYWGPTRRWLVEREVAL